MSCIPNKGIDHFCILTCLLGMLEKVGEDIIYQGVDVSGGSWWDVNGEEIIWSLLLDKKTLIKLDGGEKMVVLKVNAVVD